MQNQPVMGPFFIGLRYPAQQLFFNGVGLLINAPGLTLLFVFGAIITGLGGGPSTPASSQILARYAEPAQAPLIFSIKQTGVPVGEIVKAVAAKYDAPLEVVIRSKEELVAEHGAWAEGPTLDQQMASDKLRRACHWRPRFDAFETSDLFA